MLTDDTAEISQEFSALSEAVVQAGNWNSGAIQAENLTQRADARVGRDPARGGAVEDLTAKEAPAEPWTCASLWGYGSDLINDAGNCIHYVGLGSNYTKWTWNDGIAFSANVISTTGTVVWTIRHQNCNSCNWTEDTVRWVLQGESWWYATVDTNDDFNADSEAYSLWGPAHYYHKAVQVHDYRGRTVAGSPGGKAGLKFDNYSIFCTTLNYKGPDPSNIFTSAAWGDIPGWSMCG